MKYQVTDDKGSITLENRPWTDETGTKGEKGAVYSVGSTTPTNDRVYVGLEGKNPIFVKRESYETYYVPAMQSQAETDVDTAREEGLGSTRRTALQAVGGTAGALIGSGLGPTGSVAGGIGGAAIGSKVDDLISAIQADRDYKTKHKAWEDGGKKDKEPTRPSSSEALMSSLFRTGEDILEAGQEEALGLVTERLLPPVLGTVARLPIVKKATKEVSQGIADLLSPSKAVPVVGTLEDVARGAGRKTAERVSGVDKSLKGLLEAGAPTEELEKAALREAADRGISIPAGASAVDWLRTLEARGGTSDVVLKPYTQSAAESLADAQTRQVAREDLQSGLGIRTKPEDVLDKLYEGANAYQGIYTGIGPEEYIRQGYKNVPKGQKNVEPSLLQNKVAEVQSRIDVLANTATQPMSPEAADALGKVRAIRFGDRDTADSILMLEAAHTDLAKTYNNLKLTNPNDATVVGRVLESLDTTLDELASRGFSEITDEAARRAAIQRYDILRTDRDISRLRGLPTDVLLADERFRRVLERSGEAGIEVLTSSANEVYTTALKTVKTPDEAVAYISNLPEDLRRVFLRGGYASDLLTYTTINTRLQRGMESVKAGQALQGGLSDILTSGAPKVAETIEALSGGVPVTRVLAWVDKVYKGGKPSAEMLEWATSYATRYPTASNAAVRADAAAHALYVFATKTLNRAGVRLATEEGYRDDLVQSKVRDVVPPSKTQSIWESVPMTPVRLPTEGIISILRGE